MTLELVYRSILARHAHPACVSDIVRFARSFNRDNGITGILVFDGEHFVQLLEGEPRAVMALASRIECDRRHELFEIVHEQEHDAERRFPRWSLAYALDAGSELYSSLFRESGFCMARLARRAGSLDLGPVDARR
jgi:hypothetical protein